MHRRTGLLWACALVVAGCSSSGDDLSGGGQTAAGAGMSGVAGMAQGAGGISASGGQAAGQGGQATGQGGQATGQAGQAMGQGGEATGQGGALSCDAPGSPTTPTPTCDGQGTNCNVVPLACTRTAVKLACDVGVGSQFVVTIEGDKRKIVANGIANHDVGDFPNSGNPNTISAQSYTYTVPLTPSGQGEQVVVFGILTSGVVLDPATGETWNDDPTWRYEALRYTTGLPYFNGGTDKTMHPDALGVDCNLAHVQPTGAYHYHGVPQSFMPAAPEVTFAGWAADGYPIVVVYDHEDPNDASSPVREMKASYQIKQGDRPAGSPGGTYDGTFGADWEYVAGSGDLDECNGREGAVPIDGQSVVTYHYVLTNTFPYIPRCTRAAPDPSFARMDGGMMGMGGMMGGMGGMGGMMGPPACAPGQTSMCCGDGLCDGPETAANCAADCK